ncbi:MAG TPA: TonB family protein [Clostridia bacterium]|nr:TonB family protein [Clostridia bacterium]
MPYSILVPHELAETPSPHDGPGLLPVIESWPRVFLTNLRDLLLRRKQPPFELTCSPAEFWPDVFVPSPLPRRGLFDSVIIHTLVVIALYGISVSALFRQRQPQAVLNPFDHATISYYPVSEYLPPIESPGKPAQIARRGEPEHARQQIISVPPEPDNSRQTIVTPMPVKLTRDIALPNVIISTPVLAAQPVAPRDVSEHRLPKLTPDVVGPAPDAVPNSPRSLYLPTDVIAPAPDPISSVRKLSTSMQPSAVEPPPSTDEIKRRTGQFNMARLTAKIAEPRLAVNEQRATGAAPPPDVGAKASATAVPASPSLHGLAGTRAAGQLIALSVQPGQPTGPIEVPAGNRHGVFAVGPEGKPGAPGTPNIVGGALEKGSGGTSTAGNGTGSNPSDVPAGISVGKPPAGTVTGPVAGDVPLSNAQAPSTSLRDKLIAAARMPDIGRQPLPGTTPKADRRIEDKVFNGKKYYSLTLNMPNLSSASGTWIIRFAELRPTRDQSDLSAPVALTKSDPAYPPDLIRDRIEGTVVLYAIIHADGTVTDMRVLNSVDQRLDENAMKALARWHFRPGTKHGEPVDIEAVVQIPFRARRASF